MYESDVPRLTPEHDSIKIHSEKIDAMLVIKHCEWFQYLHRPIRMLLNEHIKIF